MKQRYHRESRSRFVQMEVIARPFPGVTISAPVSERKRLQPGQRFTYHADCDGAGQVFRSDNGALCDMMRST